MCEYLKAKYVQNEEVMESIRSQTGYCTDPIDEKLMNSEWHSHKRRETMETVISNVEI